MRVANEHCQGSVLGPPRGERARAVTDDRCRLPLVDCSGPELPAAAAAAADEMGAYEAWRVGRDGRLRERVQARERMGQRDGGDHNGGRGGPESDGGLSRKNDAAHDGVDEYPGDARGRDDRHEHQSNLTTCDARCM